MKKWLLLFLILCAPAWGAIDLSGSGSESDYFSVSDHNDFDLDAFTITFWLYKDADVSFANFVSKGDASTSTGLNYMVRADSSGKICVRFYQSTTLKEQCTASAVSTGAWHFVVAQYEGAGTAKYLRIIIDGTVSETSMNSVTPNTGSEPIIIGIADSGGITATRQVNGRMNDVAIWNVALTTEEMDLIRNSKIKRMPLQVQSSALVGYWPFDGYPSGTGFDGTTVKDYSSKGHDLTGTDTDTDASSVFYPEVVLTYP